MCSLGKNSWNQGVEVGSDHLSKTLLSILMTVLHEYSKEDWNGGDNKDPGCKLKVPHNYFRLLMPSDKKTKRGVEMLAHDDTTEASG